MGFERYLHPLQPPSHQYSLKSHPEQMVRTRTGDWWIFWYSKTITIPSRRRVLLSIIFNHFIAKLKLCWRKQEVVHIFSQGCILCKLIPNSNVGWLRPQFKILCRLSKAARKKKTKQRQCLQHKTLVPSAGDQEPDSRMKSHQRRDTELFQCVNISKASIRTGL